MSQRPVGLDTNLFIRQAARRMLAACCERTGRSVYLPGQTLREAPRKIMPLYARAAARTCPRREGESGNARMERVLAAHRALCDGFARWMREEEPRNDSIYEYGEGEAEDAGAEIEELAYWITQSGGIADESDAFIIAECMRRGTLCLTTDNRRTIQRGRLHDWLSERKEAGDPKAGTVELPLVLSADEAVRLLCGEGNAGFEAAIATAYGVSRTEGPRSADQRVGTLAWFANDLEKAGLGDTASSIHRTLESWQGMEAQLIARLDSIAPKAPKTRGGEDRRLDLERGAGRRRPVTG